MQDDRRDHEEEEKKGQESSGINWDDYLDDGAEVPASHYKERGKNPALKVALLAVLIVAVIAGVATRTRTTGTPISCCAGWIRARRSPM